MSGLTGGSGGGIFGDPLGAGAVSGAADAFSSPFGGGSLFGSGGFSASDPLGLGGTFGFDSSGGLLDPSIMPPTDPTTGQSISPANANALPQANQNQQPVSNEQGPNAAGVQGQAGTQSGPAPDLAKLLNPNATTGPSSFVAPTNPPSNQTQPTGGATGAWDQTPSFESAARGYGGGTQPPSAPTAPTNQTFQQAAYGIPGTPQPQAQTAAPTAPPAQPAASGPAPSLDVLTAPSQRQNDLASILNQQATQGQTASSDQITPNQVQTTSVSPSEQPTNQIPGSVGTTPAQPDSGAGPAAAGTQGGGQGGQGGVPPQVSQFIHHLMQFLPPEFRPIANMLLHAIGGGGGGTGMAGGQAGSPQVPTPQQYQQLYQQRQQSGQSMEGIKTPDQYAKDYKPPSQQQQQSDVEPNAGQKEAPVERSDLPDVKPGTSQQPVGPNTTPSAAGVPGQAGSPSGAPSYAPRAPQGPVSNPANVPTAGVQGAPGGPSGAASLDANQTAFQPQPLNPPPSAPSSQEPAATNPKPQPVEADFPKANEVPAGSVPPPQPGPQGQTMGALPNQGNRPAVIRGNLSMGNGSYRFVSGGGRTPSLPYGTYYLTGQNGVGPIGRRIGAISGISDHPGSGNTVNDPTRSPRRGVELHPLGRSGLTDGCIGIAGNWNQFQQDYNRMSQGGRVPLTLTLRPDGSASIQPLHGQQQAATMQNQARGQPSEAAADRAWQGIESGYGRQTGGTGTIRGPFQQSRGFYQQYGRGGDYTNAANQQYALHNYASQVIRAHPNVTMGELYTGYHEGTGNPAGPLREPGQGAFSGPGGRNTFALMNRVFAENGIDPNAPAWRYFGAGGVPTVAAGM